MLSQIVCHIILFIVSVNSFNPVVKLKQGEIRGTREQTIFGGRTYDAYYGVPYAQPPVGKLRFKDPKPPEKWKKPFYASVEFHGACAQAHIVHKHAVYGVEDCLYMNIFTPMLNAKTRLKPVLVFIHGYAFSSSLSTVYGADFIIDKDIIFISVLHRIGVFGFLKVNDDDSHANMGLKDIIMALKWIRKNINRFGGNKNKITVMGNDSGATFLSLLLMTKHRKLFSKIILQSGTSFSPSLFQGNHITERERLKKNLRRMGLRDILAAPTHDIITASQKIYTSKELINFQKPVVPFTPFLEDQSNNKSLLVYRPDEFYKKLVEQNVTNYIMVGFNSRESISEIIPFIHNPQYLKSFASYFKFMTPFADGCIYNYTSNSYKEVASKIKAHYFNNDISDSSLEDFLQYTTDLRIYPIWKFVQAYLNYKKTNVFVYKFNYVGSLNAVKATSVAGVNVKVKGASNGDELCYLLKCEPLWETYVNLHNDTNNRDRKFMAEIVDLWTNFVKTGNPTPDSQSKQYVWQPMTSIQDNILLLGKVTKLIEPKVENKMYQFWNDIYNTMYSSNHCVRKNHEEL